MSIEECLDPLAELKVILVLRIDQLRDVNVALYSILVESLLKNFVVFDEFIVVL